MTSHHHFLSLHFHNHHLDLEIIAFYVFNAIYRTSHVMFNLLIPIFLIEIGYNLWQVAAYFLIYQAWFMLAMPFSGNIIKRMGLKHAMAFHIPFLIAFYIGVQHLSGSFFKDVWFLIIVLGLRGFFKTTYNVARDAFIANHLVDKDHSGKNLATMKIIRVFASIAAPLLGGLVTHIWGFDAVFATGIALVLISSVPLILTPNHRVNLHSSSNHIYSIAKKKVDHYFLWAEVGRVIPDTVMWIMWPLFIYFVVKNTANLGLLVSGSTLLSIVISYYVGKHVDRKNPEKMLKKAVHGATGLFFLRAFSFHPLLIGLIDIANKVLNPILEIPYNFYVYKMVKKHPDPIEMSGVKNLISEGLYTIGVIVIMILTMFFPHPSTPLFMVMFATSAFFLMLMTFVSKINLSTHKIDL